MEGLTRLRLRTRPLHPPHPLLLTHLLYRAIYDITVAVKEVAEKPVRVELSRIFTI